MDEDEAGLQRRYAVLVKGGMRVSYSEQGAKNSARHVNERSAPKLVYGVLIPVSQRWRRVKMTDFELVQLRKIRRITAYL